MPTWFRPALLLAVITVLATACGGDDDGEATSDDPLAGAFDASGDDSDDPGDEGADDPEGTTPDAEATSNDETDGVCAEPTEVGIGSSTDGETSGASPTACYWVQVPDGLDTLSLELTGLTADLSLTAGYGLLVSSPFTMGEVVESIEAGPAEESIEVDGPGGGPWFVRISPAGVGEESPYTLSISADPATQTEPTGTDVLGADACPAFATTLQLGESIDGEVPEREGPPLPRDYFCVEIPSGASRFAVDVSGLSDHLDVIVSRVGGNVVGTDVSRGGDSRSVVVDGAEPGQYVVQVVAALQGAASTFTIQAS